MFSVDITLEPGEHRRHWAVGIRDLRTGDEALLPPTVDWHAAIHLVNELTRIYGHLAVRLYQWDITVIVSDGLVDMATHPQTLASH